MQVKSIEEEMLGNGAVRWISGFSFHGHLRSSPPPYSPCSPCPAAWPSSSSPARLWSATPSSSLCGSALPRPAPVPAACSPRPAPVPTPCSPCPCPAVGAACSLLALRAPPVRTKGQRRRLRFLARFFHLARAQQDPCGVGSRRRLCTTRSQPSSPSGSTSARCRLTTRRLRSLSSFTVANGGGYCKISTWRRRPARPLYVP